MTIEKIILKLRLQVLALGEQQEWWNSSFFSEESTSFLEYIFPKTNFAASVIAASEVGKAVHDDAVGVGKFHLFRLPQRMEERIHKFVVSDKELQFLLKSIRGNELELLENMSEYISIDSIQGPVNIGAYSELEETDFIAALARHYYEAFNNNYKTFPYLR